MSQYLTKFEAWRTASFAQDDAAAQPAGWTARFGSVITDSVRLGSPPTTVKRYGWSGRLVAFAQASWDLIDADANRANIEIVTGMRSVADDSQDGGFAIFARGSTSATTYYECSILSGTLYIKRMVAGVSGTLASVVQGSAGYVTDSNRMYHVRFRVTGNTLSAKIWGRDVPEPASWSLSVTDTLISAAGTCGVRFGYTEFFSVGTNGDTAALPKTLIAASDELRAAVNGGKPVLCTCDLEVPGYTGSGSVAGRVFRRYSNLPFNTGTVAPLAAEVYNARMLAIPSVTREMADLSGGVVKVGGADVQLANGDGALDDIFRTRLFRMPAICRIGLPGWAWYDLLPYHQGVIQDVSDDGGRTLTLAIDGTAREFDGDVTLAYSTSGVNDKKPLPQLYGKGRNISPVLVDATKLIYQYGAVDRTLAAIRDKGVAINQITGLVFFAAFDAAADTLTSSAAHDMVVGQIFQLGLSGSLPAPLLNGRVVQVTSVPAVDKITVSLTDGGATVDLTGASGAISGTANKLGFLAFGTGSGIQAPTGCVRLLQQPAGQITCDHTLATTISWSEMLNLTGLPSAKFQSSASHFPAFELFNLFIKDRISKISVIDEMAARGRPVTFSRNGAMAWRPINFAAIEATFTEADCFGIPRLSKTLQPTAGRVGEPNWTVQSPTDLAGSVTPANVALYGQPQYYLITALGIDYQQGLWWGGLVDDPALYRDTLPDKSVGGIADTNVLTGTGYTTLNSNEGRQRAAGVYEITVAFKSVLLDCGDVVKLTHRRHFFKDVVNEIDVSPERPATAIGAQRQPSLAVVTKIVDDPANSRQTLTLYRPMPTLFPAS